jgi:hypothetical protein
VESPCRAAKFYCCCGAGEDSSTMSRQFSAASLTSTSGRREVSDEDVAEYAKQLVVPRYGAPRVFVTSAKQGVSSVHDASCMGWVNDDSD